MNIKDVIKNPEKWAKSASLPELRSLVIRAKDAYYEGNPLFNDAVYDQIEKVLLKRSPNSVKVGTSQPSQNKVKLPYPMFSLDKVKTIDELENWLENNEDGDGIVVMDKMDGISAEYINENGVLHLYTRGDGKRGKDITLFIPHIKTLPKKLPRGAAVRGELEMTNGKFSANWEDTFANPRNMVSGITNRLDIHEALAHIDFIAYERLDKRQSPTNQFDSLRQLGFKVVPNKFIKWHDVEPYEFPEMLQRRKTKSKYAIDGLVIAINAPYSKTTSGNPDYAVAFKQNVAADIKTVTVKNIIWSESRQGRLTPIIEIEPTKMQGVTVTRVTAHNGKMIVDRGIGPGAKVRVTRSGDVIPFIIDVVKPVKAKIPKNTVWKGAFLYANQKSDEGEVRYIEHFFTIMGVDGLKYGSVRRLYDEGYTLYDILHAPKADLVAELGVNGEKIYNSIKKKLAELDLPTLMEASQCFENWAKNRLALVVETFGDPLKTKITKADLTDIHSIGPILVKTFFEGLPKFKKFVKDLGVKYKMPKKIKGSLTGEIIAFTGFRNKDWVSEIEAKGGIYKDSVTKDVTLLVAKDLNSSKAKRAKELGTKIMSPNQFEMFLNK